MPAAVVPANARLPNLLLLVGVLLARAALDELVYLSLDGLAWRSRAPEIPVQSRPDWSVVYQLNLLPQTNVCTCIMPRFGCGFIFSSVAREGRGK